MWCNLVVVLAAVSVTVAFPVEPLKGGEIDRWFVQKLDHFDLTNPKTWKQRYQVNGTWFKGSKSSPIMLYVEGEITIGPKNESVFLKHYGYLKKYAEEFGAICFVLEHRYYGESHPTEDLSVENLRFLTTQQALADVAQFIVGMNKLYQFQPTNRWILFGGSYAGSLVAWARLKYPHLVHAAVSSSPALISTVGQREYYEAVKETLASYNKSCAENFHQGALDIASLLKEPKGADIISKKVVFTYGTVDPWQAFGIRNSSDPDMPVIKIEGEAHCSDMGDFPPGGLSEAVKTARSQIMGLLGKWISE
ncbi:hypothetical protein GE061_018124 [Apolygus lucorum]|uniref:Uncharacterized protein n=1 Tax=Apolygus lucorum TaxID=248454 RepID=A0A8S9XF35_APOLU|nr:hypothetical protein GE061_018124 [Apolygus lucorum]